MHARRFCLAVAMLVCWLAVGWLSLPRLADAQTPIGADEGRPQVMWQNARGVVGKMALVAGKVINVKKVGRITFINFDDQRPRRFEAAIFDDNIANFPKPPAEMYDGKIINIRGRVTLFQDRPQIIITSPEQIDVLDALPQESKGRAVKPRTPAKPGELVIGSYNSLNLFDGHDDPYRDDEGTPAKPREEMEKLAASIESLNADVLAMEEVENRDYLERFVDVFLPDMGYENVVLFEGNDGRGIDVALLSRVPVGPVRSHRHIRFPGPNGEGTMRFNRDVLAVTLQPEGGPPLEVWVVHLKSKRGSGENGVDETEPIRLAEAAEIRKLLDAEMAKDPQARIIVTGDFNDTLESKSIQTIVGGGPTAMWSAITDLGPNPQLVSYNEEPFRSVIDHMLCTPAMRERYVKGSFRVPQGSVDTTGSDHNPVAATFRVD
jgi:endonuclease/exonuclease/phosphatase family metal-dependent hydrolase